MNKSGTTPIITASGHDIDIITSEISTINMAKVTMVNFILGAEMNTTSYSLKPTGFAQYLCQHDCLSTHVLHIYTNDAIIVYHGNQSYVADPSARLKNSLTYHNITGAATLGRRLFPADSSTSTELKEYDGNGRKLYIPVLVWGGRLLFPIARNYVIRAVRNEVKKEIRDYAYSQVQCVYNRYTNQQVCN
jgi:hypothetical protein